MDREFLLLSTVLKGPSLEERIHKEIFKRWGSVRSIIYRIVHGCHITGSAILHNLRFLLYRMIFFNENPCKEC
jgi:hypothetical protein